MEWYKKLSIQQKINLKELSKQICGVEYKLLISLFGMRTTLELLYNKLKIEGFNV